MGTMIVIVVGITCCVGLFCYFDFKKKELEYSKECVNVGNTSIQRDIEREKTEQLRIKFEYRDKHDSCLY